MITTTLNKIREHQPCAEGWKKLLGHLGKTEADDEPLPFAAILKSNGLDDALWCCRAAPEYHKEWRLFAVWCARQVQHLMKDQRSIDALDLAERFAHGLATEEELSAAREAARAARATMAAWGSAEAAEAAVRDAAGAAWAAAMAAWGSAEAAAEAAEAAVRDAVMDAARDAARAAQAEEFLRIVGEMK
jgi:hypothetical protein